VEHVGKATIGVNVMLMVNEQRVLMLSHYMEAVGHLEDIVEKDCTLLAYVGGHIVILPVQLKDVLAPHIGRRIAIIRTDICGKEYLVRRLPENDAEYCARDVEKGRAHTHSIFL
jgi:hypothetical protein